MDAATIESEGKTAEVQISLFGGVSTATDDGVAVDVGPAKCQVVLAALALSPGSAVPVSRIVALVWGDDPPRTADKTLQSYVTRLRKGLGNDTIVRTGAAYRLDVEQDAVDVARFQRLLGLGNTEAALGEWTGTPLAGLDAPALTATVDGLVEQYLGAVEAQLGRQIGVDAAATIGPLTELTATYPFREGLWALLMTALYRVGRQADALAAYRRAREHLVEDLGVEPGPRLRELESRILGHDEVLGVDTTGPGSPLGQPTGTVTFGFSDVENSTRLWAAHRNEMAEAMARHDELVRGLVDRHGGYVFATGGDSFGVAFHRASDAVGWASGLQAVLREERWPGDVVIRVRIGLHTGETEERGKGYFGPAVIVAARLSAAGHGGQTLVSGVTAGLLVGNGLRDLGSHRLDGVVAEQRILQLGDGEHPPLRTDGSRSGNLPRRLGKLIGREDDLAVVRDALTSSPVVTLVGPGGIGKTRLALAAARRADVDGGAWLVELATTNVADDVPRAVAAVLDVKQSAGRTITEAIVASLASRRALLVLDNCEHVIGGAASIARAVAEGCPNVRVLATSREGLGLRDEQLVTVAPLDPAGSGVELFEERALAVSRTFDPVASRADVEEICRRLDGVPLAIELAAARTRSLSPADLVERLDDRLRLLTGGRRASVERHRTLRATIQWSYDLLSEDEQTLFRRLSIFAGPFDLLAAEAVAVDEDLGVADVDELLGDLVDRSMVIVESGPFGPRFRLLETMRQFGAEHLSGAGRTDLIAARHARWCLDSVARIHDLLASPDEIEGTTRLDELWPNLRAAVDFAITTGDRSLARDIFSPVMPETYLRSRGEIGEWCERILEITPPDDTEMVTWGVVWAARRYMRHMDREGYERLVARFGEPDHPMLRYARGFIWFEHERMVEAAQEAVDLLRQEGDRYVADIFAVTAQAVSLLLAGRLQAVDELLGALSEQFRRHGPPTALQHALTFLGTSASIQGRADEAMRFWKDAAEVAVPARTHTLKNPLEAERALRRGDEAQALAILRDYVQELLDTENTYIARTTCVTFITVMVEVGHLAEAARIVGFLEATGSLDVPAWRSLVAGARRRIGEKPGTGRERELGRELDDRLALTFMRDALVEHLDRQ